MLYVFMAFALMASAISANKVILYALSPSLLVAIRMLVAGLILLVYTYVHSHQRLKWEIIKSHIGLLILVSASTTYIPSLLKAYALQNMNSSKAAFFGTLDPFVTAVYAYFLFDERLTLKKILGIVLGFAGACLLLFSTSPLEEHLKAFSFISYPELAALAAVVISRYGWITIQKLLKRNIYAPAQINTITMLVSGVLSLVTALVQNQLAIKPLGHATLPLFEKFPFSHFSSWGILLFFLSYTILIGNVISYNLYADVLKKYSATFVSLASFSIPLAVHLYGWLFLSESLSAQFFISCTITFIGLVLFFKDEQKA